MGHVYITDERGKPIWDGENSLTTAFQLRLLQSLSQSRVPPIYCGVGVSYASLSFTPWTRLNLVSEVARLRAAGGFVDPISGRAAVVTPFRVNNCNTVWKEIGLFDSGELVDYGNRKATSCDSINKGGEEWISSGILIADPTDPIDGNALLRVTGNGSVLSNDFVNFFDSTKLDLGRARLQFYLAIDDPTSLHATEGLLVTLITPEDESWSWVIDDSALTSGLNHIDLRFSEATMTAEAPDYIIANRLSLQAISADSDTAIAVDRFRIYQDSGTMYARTEIHPAIKKDFDQTFIVTWLIDPVGDI